MIQAPAPGDLRDFAGRVVRLLEDLEIAYAVCGSMAAMEYSEPRLSIDIDLMVFIDSRTLSRFAHTIEQWGYYMTPVEVIEQEMIPMGRPFNIIDGASGVKADIYPIRDAGLEGAAMQRRRRRAMNLAPERETWCLAPEDVILFKLRHFRRGGEVAQKHPMDIAKMIEVMASELDADYIAKWAPQLGLSDLWEPLWKQRPNA